MGNDFHILIEQRQFHGARVFTEGFCKVLNTAKHQKNLLLKL